MERLPILVSTFILIILTSTAYAQNKTDLLWIDKFTKPTNRSLLNGKWYKEGPGTKLDYVKDPIKNSQVLHFSYSFEEQYTNAVFASMCCTIPLESIQGVQITGIAYDFKGAGHRLAYRTSSTLDFGFFQKRIPESSEWTTIFIPTNELTQPPWATKVAFNPLHLQTLAWQLWGSPKDTGSIWIDNVRFILGKEQPLKPISFCQDSIAEIVFSVKIDSAMDGAVLYKTEYTKYHQSIDGIEACKKTGDSILMLFKNSTLSEKELKQAYKIIHLTFNDIEGDAHIETTKISKALLKKINQLVPVTFLEALDKKYKTYLTTINFSNAWATGLWNYGTSTKIDYPSKSISDSVFKNELTLYKFENNDTIAEIGAGNGFFEQALSRYCNDLVVYVNEIDSASIKQLDPKLRLLDLYDKKNISFITSMGDETTTNLPSGKFDKLIVKNSFHHFTYPNEMLQDFKRILKPGGQLFLSEIMIDEVEHPECKLFLTRKMFLHYLTSNGYILVNETMLQYSNFRSFEFRIVP